MKVAPPSSKQWILCDHQVEPSRQPLCSTLLYHHHNKPFCRSGRPCRPPGLPSLNFSPLYDTNSTYGLAFPFPSSFVHHQCEPRLCKWCSIPPFLSLVSAGQRPSGPVFSCYPTSLCPEVTCTETLLPGLSTQGPLTQQTAKLPLSGYSISHTLGHQVHEISTRSGETAFTSRVRAVRQSCTNCLS